MPFDPYAYTDQNQRMAAWEAAGRPTQGSNAQYGTFDLDVRGHDAQAGFRGTGITDPFAFTLGYGPGTSNNPGATPGPTGSPAPVSAPTSSMPPAPTFSVSPGVQGAPALPTGGINPGGIVPGTPVASHPTDPLQAALAQMFEKSMTKPGHGAIVPGTPAPTGGTPPWLAAGRPTPTMQTSGIPATPGMPTTPGMSTTTQFPYPGSVPVPGAWPTFPGSQGEGENRQWSQSGLDPRLDAMYQYALQQAMSRYSDPNGMQYYSGQTVAGLTPDELQAQNMLRAFANGGGLGTGAQDFFTSALARGTNPGASPDLQAAINAMAQDTSRQFTDPGGAFSQIRGNALAEGNFGGSRQGVLEGITMGRLADSIGRTSADMRLAGRNQDLGTAIGALGQTPNVTSASMLPANVLSGVGAQNRAQEQLTMNDLLTRWAYNTTQPDIRLQNLFNMISGAPLGQYNMGSSTISPAALALAGAQGGNSNVNNAIAALAAGGGLWNLLGLGG